MVCDGDVWRCSFDRPVSGRRRLRHAGVQLAMHCCVGVSFFCCSLLPTKTCK